MFCFGNDFAGPRRHTHEICSSFGQRYIALDQSFTAPFYFIFHSVLLSRNVWFVCPPEPCCYEEICHVINCWKRPISIVCCGCSYFPLGEGYLSLILYPLPRGFEWFLFVTKNYSPGEPRGSTHGDANDKCFMAVIMFHSHLSPDCLWSMPQCHVTILCSVAEIFG